MAKKSVKTQKGKFVNRKALGGLDKGVLLMDDSMQFNNNVFYTRMLQNVL